MDISRSTLREAIAVLVRAGVLTVKTGAGRGNFVATPVIPWRALEERAQLRVAEVGPLLEARRVIEPRVAQLASMRGTEHDFAAMAATIERQRRDPDDSELFAQLNWQFHRRLASAARNPVLEETLRSLYRRLAIAMDMIRGREEPAWSIAIHERTLASVMRGDHEEIEAAMEEHMSFLEGIWEQESGRSRIRTPPPFLVGSPPPRAADPPGVSPTPTSAAEDDHGR